MYRAFTFRLEDDSFPVARLTREHPEVKAVAYNVGRDPEMALPLENIYLIRAPLTLHDEIRTKLADTLDILKEHDTPERDVLILQARARLPEKGQLRGMLGVLSEAVGLVLDYRPMIITDGAVEIQLLTLPKTDTGTRLRALAEFAREEGLPFTIVRDDLVPTLPVRTPRLGVLHLMESQVFQALAASGAYDLDGPGAEAIIKSVGADVEEALGLDRKAYNHTRRAAEKKVMREYARALQHNLRLSTSQRKPPPGH